MGYSIIALLTFSIGIAAIIAVIRFPKIDKAFLPFILLVWLGLCNETYSEIVIRMGYSNAVNANIFSLLESLLILWLLKNFRLFNKRMNVFYILSGLFVSAWVAENFFIGSIHRFSSYFIVLYSFIVVIMSIHMINRLIALENNNLLKNALFLICIGFILFFTYNLLVEIFWIYGLNKSKNFRINVYRIMSCINLIVNLIYALAVLWIPPKQKSILL